MNDSVDVQPSFGVEKIYLRDASFEAPNSPAIFTQSFSPEVALQLNVETEQVGEHHYQVTLVVTATVKTGEAEDAETAFLVEIQQAGIFVLQNIPEGDLRPVLGIECPNILFPYAREAVSDLVIKGGFQPLLLSPVNFAAMFAQNEAEQQAAGHA